MTKRIAELRALVGELLDMIPEPVCHRLHHRPAERHNLADKCPAEARCRATIHRAAAALAKLDN